MASISKIFVFLNFFYGFSNLCWASEESMQSSSDFNLTTMEVIKKYGYPGEVHKVETEDGYILELHRIPHGKKSKFTHNVPILLVHGMISSSSSFFLRKSESLGFVLADAGYDIWMPNLRGCPYSKNHKVLSPEHKKFWDFSWHEIGMYDLPASIDYTLRYTKRDQLLYIGYSMGTTAFFVMASTIPEYQKKLRGAILLGPTAYMGHAKTPSRNFAFFSGTLKGPFEFIANEEVFEKYSEHQNSICAHNFFCRHAAFLLSGSDAKQFYGRILPALLNKAPSSTSLRTIVHYGQLMASGKFQQYDYGILKNFVKYHQAKPPGYNLEAITVPLSLFVAPNDYFNCKIDVDHTVRRLPNVKNVFRVPHPPFTHLDFVVAENVKGLVYENVVQQIQYLINGAQ